MARAYKRDSRGRFAGGGGGGGGKKSAPTSKAGATRAANAATDAKLLGMGLRATGSRLRSKVAAQYSGAKSTQQRNAKMWEGGGRRNSSIKTPGAAVSGNSTMRAAANAARSKAVERARSKAASKNTTKMSKAPASAAKAEFKALRSKQRQDRRYSGVMGTDRKAASSAAATTRKLNRMVSRRKR